MRQPAMIWGHPRTRLTATAPSSGVSEITDTEEVTGSNPVSPTSFSPSQVPVSAPGTEGVPAKCPLHSGFEGDSRWDFDGSANLVPIGTKSSELRSRLWPSDRDAQRLCKPSDPPTRGGGGWPSLCAYRTRQARLNGGALPGSALSVGRCSTDAQILTRSGDRITPAAAAPSRPTASSPAARSMHSMSPGCCGPLVPTLRHRHL